MRKIFCRIFRTIPVVSYASVRPHICFLSSFTAQAPGGCIFNYRSRRLIGSGLRASFMAVNSSVSCTHLDTYCTCVRLCLGALCPSPMHTYIHVYILYYKAKSLCICLFSLSAKKFTNRLTQTRKIGKDCRVNFSWSSEHSFNFLRSVIQKLRVF